MLSHLRVLDLTDGGTSIAGRILAELLGLDQEAITALVISGAVE